MTTNGSQTDGGDWYAAWREALRKDPNYILPADEEWWEDWTRRAENVTLPEVVKDETKDAGNASSEAEPTDGTNYI